jgi:hypothetical protein
MRPDRRFATLLNAGMAVCALAMTAVGSMAGAQVSAGKNKQKADSEVVGSR